MEKVCWISTIRNQPGINYKLILNLLKSIDSTRHYNIEHLVCGLYSDENYEFMTWLKQLYINNHQSLLSTSSASIVVSSSSSSDDSNTGNISRDNYNAYFIRCKGEGGSHMIRGDIDMIKAYRIRALHGRNSNINNHSRSSIK